MVLPYCNCYQPTNHTDKTTSKQKPTKYGYFY